MANKRFTKVSLIFMLVSFGLARCDNVTQRTTTTSTTTTTTSSPSSTISGSNPISNTINSISSSTIISSSIGSRSSSCLRGCRCLPHRNVANCSGANLRPTSHITLPARTRFLILDDNSLISLTPGLLDESVNVSELELLSVRHSNLSEVKEDALERLVQLKELRLDNNALKHLPERLFEHNTRLAILSLANNSLSIDSLGSLFAHLPNLLTLDLSRSNMEQQRLPAAFSNLTSLQEFTFRDVTITNVTEDFFLSLTETKLVKLDLSQSVLQNVAAEAFVPLVYLKELVLENSVISTQDLENVLSGFQNSSLEILNLNDVFVFDGRENTVTSHMFRFLETSRLKRLYFRGNYAGLHGKIHARLFQPLKNLHELFLDRCDLMSIPADAFRGLHHLKVLSITSGLLSCARESDCHFLTIGVQLPLLHTLDLYDNRLSESENTVRFSEEIFPKLVHLNLRKNKLRSISFGMFGKLYDLYTLDLSENPIEEIARNAFEDLTSLRKLNIENCPRLGRISAEAFAGLGALKLLNLQNSGVFHIYHGALNHMTHLEELLLRNNRLGESDDAIARLTLKKSALKVLDMGGNKLSTMPTGLLMNSRKLTFVNLDNNRFFDCRGLSPLIGSDVEYLDLSYNRFVHPTKECFEEFASLSSINLAGNPFMCTCALKPLTDWLVRMKLVGEELSEYTCVAPDMRVGVNMLRVSYSTWECSGRTIIFATVAACVSVLLFCGLVLLTHRKCARCHQKKSCDAADANVESSQTDTGRLNGCAVTESSARYSPLEEEEVRENGEATLVDEDQGCYDATDSREFVEVHSYNGYIGDAKLKSGSKKPPRLVDALTGNCSRSSQSRASSRSSSSRLIADAADNDVISLTSEQDRCKPEGQMEDAV